MRAVTSLVLVSMLTATASVSSACGAGAEPRDRGSSADAGSLEAAAEPDAQDVPGLHPSDGGPPTWTALYAAYFGPGTPGHCGNDACHAMNRAGFACGASASSCYLGLVNVSMIDPANPTASALADPNQSPLVWLGGNMPRDNLLPNAQAAADVAAWVRAGAQND